LVTQAVLFLLQTGRFELVADLGCGGGEGWERGGGERGGGEVRGRWGRVRERGGRGGARWGSEGEGRYLGGEVPSLVAATLGVLLLLQPDRALLQGGLEQFVSGVVRGGNEVRHGKFPCVAQQQ